MFRGVVRTARYARGWQGHSDVIERDVEIQRDGSPVEATLVMPRRTRGPLPAWVAVGGVSLMGRRHPQLVRFSRALAATRAAVIVPEVPEWRRLAVVPDVTAPTIRGCIDALPALCDVRTGGVGLIGFSFGAPQVAISAACPQLADRVRGVVLFGGYCCLDRTLVCQLTGEHEWGGVGYSLAPDPYGRWVVGCNHLTDVPGLEDRGELAAALRCLATAASGQRIAAWESHHDDLIRRLRATLPERDRALYDQFATPSGAERPDRAAGLELARELARACRRVAPLLEPAADLSRVRVPTQLIHGRGDRLIPFTEGRRLMAGLPESARRKLTVTGLFNHSAGRSPGGAADRVREGAKLFGAIRTLINTV